MHTPVLLNEMLDILNPQDGKVYVDATFGAGGYTRAILKSANCQVYAIDQDECTNVFYEKLVNDFPGKVHFCVSKFSKIKQILHGAQLKKVDGIVFDIGVSSMQLEDASRGFSFSKDGPLDMRMSTSISNVDASVFVNTAFEEEIANVIYQYGGEKYSRKIAKAIAESRKKKPIKTTGELASIVRSVISRSKNHSIDPATRTFQAIRIWVNKELEELEQGIIDSADLLNPGGKIIVVSFHSLEDRIVKVMFKSLCSGSSVISPIGFQLINKKVIRPSFEEILNNPRSRSAKLRAILKI
ncbi:S-adenosyl-methyltransferase MraW [Ehrlichia chaffeensis str. Arkansas]|uniref:Ribosomal RNA small subunit methyltransferase H n=1 Tax=Ehrlichia chaffeensis (strain ATCC CRL-10679 / Arkansas) TaxID=205920 RepID=RSMH_EHRCR|nr:16S rRNA (cytosine(1402)-N(4))-methyltransferase RsmH [Ehrlichia chaffeensis]Q2GGS8.1 RecName: Full=Ribosomal RNA small subunit methyltransferase H; AltName: Full=16S rRNA m(4)C1402 methyltransferase; AltName: Full=rRNA (cytosine-N(4)-)-methyltransferase RsmH [Ehrlichia chaffeensis str. Arkansas]ABD44511.1 S-adenosyl-methyltransferase MraW [Ehrlichia chaffeensis str. Arkansas]AHX05644.1 16S rRNA (cytosine(1402)-N(4))-methyltransferase [Ehrlichia chaffeensis str. Jax]AHX07923.1 16S rRNA (cyto